MAFENQILDRLVAITNTLNAIQANSKRTEEFPHLEPLDNTGKIRVSVEGVSFWIAISEISSLIDALGFDVNNFGFDLANSTSGSSTTEQEIVDYINSIGFTVNTGNLIQLSIVVKKNDYFYVKKYNFRRNNITGNWGTGFENGEINISDLVETGEIFIGNVPSGGSDVLFNLGDIGSDNIFDYLNARNTTLDPYRDLLDDGSIYYFSAIINGDNQIYRYVGSLPKTIGQGQDVLVFSDFDLISNNAPVVNWSDIQGDQKDVNLMGFTDGVDKTIVHAAPENNAWYSIATDGNGTWIGVSGNGTNRILKSTDNGVTWTVQPSPENNSWYSIVTDGNGTWIGVANSGTNRILKSTDNGNTWTVHAAPENNDWYSIATDGNGTWIGVANNGINRILKSVDNGSTWSVQPSPENNAWRSIATDGNGTWIVVSLYGTNRILKSVDNGVTWTVHAAPEQSGWISIATDGNGTWIGVADGGTNRILKSVDNGNTWSVQPSPENNSWYSIVTDGNGTWIGVALSGTNRILKSTDNGVTWTVQSSLEQSGWRSISTDGNGTWIGVAYNGINQILKISHDIKFENIVNQYQINGTPINPVNKVLNIEIPEAGASTLQEVTENGATTTHPITSPKFIDSNGTERLTGTSIDLSNNIDGTIYNNVTPSAAASFSVINLKSGGFATNYIDTTGKTDFPTVTNAAGLVIPTQSDAFREDAEFMMMLYSANGIDVEVFFVDYLNLDPIGGDGDKITVKPTLADATYTLTNSDVNKVIVANNTDTVITVNDSSINRIGDVIYIDYYGTGTCEIVQGSTILLTNSNDTLFLDGQYSRVAVQKMSATQMRVFGQLIPA